MVYHPEQYWSKRTLDRFAAHDHQEKVLLDTLKQLNFKTVMEFGCGTGRIAKILKDNFDIDKYLGIDFSQFRIDEARKVTSQDYTFEFKTTDASSFHRDMKYDLVLGIEFLMHVKPSQVNHMLKNMLRHTKQDLITLDYYPIAGYDYILQDHNFLHKYPDMIVGEDKLFEIIPVSNYQHIFHVMVEKFHD